MAKFKVTIDGMSCMHCVGHVQDAFKECEGVHGLEVKIGEAVVEGDITEKQIRDIIDDQGYDVVKIEEL